MSAGGSAHIVTLAIRARQVLPSITFIVIHGLARLSWSAAEGADVGIDPDMGPCTAASVSRVGRGVFVG